MPCQNYERTDLKGVWYTRFYSLSTASQIPYTCLQSISRCSKFSLPFSHTTHIPLDIFIFSNLVSVLTCPWNIFQLKSLHFLGTRSFTKLQSNHRYTKLEVAWKRCPIIFQGHPSNFKVTRDKKSLILTRIDSFQKVTLVWIHWWLSNDA